jgi:hypothetical protein
VARYAETLTHYIPIFITIATIIATLSFKGGEYYNEMVYAKSETATLKSEVDALKQKIQMNGAK